MARPPPSPRSLGGQPGARLAVQRERGGPTHCPGSFGSRRQHPELRVGNRQATRRPSRPPSRTSCFSSQGQRTIKGAGEQLTGSKRDRQRLQLALPRVSGTARPPQAPAHGAGRLPAAHPRLPQRSHGRRGPGLPEHLCRGLPHPRAAASLRRRPLAPPEPSGTAGRRSQRRSEPVGRGGPPDSLGCCCLSGHLVPCVVSLPSPRSALLPPPPPPPPAPHTTQHGLFAAAVAAAAAGAPPRSSSLPSPNLPPAAPGPPVRTRATISPPRPLAGSASCHRFPERPHALWLVLSSLLNNILLHTIGQFRSHLFHLLSDNRIDLMPIIPRGRFGREVPACDWQMMKPLGLRERRSFLLRSAES